MAREPVLVHVYDMVSVDQFDSIACVFITIGFYNFFMTTQKISCLSVDYIILIVKSESGVEKKMLSKFVELIQNVYYFKTSITN